MKAIYHVVAGVSDNSKQNKKKLIHEQDFVRASSVATASRSIIECISCGIYYDELSREALSDDK